ncbi:uncharacterized protein [Eurosta solidaginis]|uniref:uncharacterized protein n=1 Tax=Eurosta solidaginis TaxID=178769 RepID=UPI0035315903
MPKATLQLCKHHYDCAADILDNLREASDYLVVQLERISLQEFLNEISSTTMHKHLQTALSLLLKSKIIFEHALNINNATESNSPNDKLCKHMVLFESRLQNTLKTLIKVLLNGRDPKKLVAYIKRCI